MRPTPPARTLLAAALLWASPAVAAGPVGAGEAPLEELEAEERELEGLGESPVLSTPPGAGRIPTLQLSMRAALRDGTFPGTSLELGIDLLHIGEAQVITSFSFEPDRPLAIPGLARRSYSQLEGLVDVMVPAGGWLTLGPSATIAVRQYEQDGLSGFLATPTVGGRASVGIAGSRTWRLSLDSRVTCDLFWNTLIIGTASVQTLSPLQVQAGLRFDLGPGLRLPGDR